MTTKRYAVRKDSSEAVRQFSVRLLPGSREKLDEIIRVSRLSGTQLCERWIELDYAELEAARLLERKLTPAERRARFWASLDSL